jgi:hypothetical protein
MDNVLNRPLFRHREARDRLNESIGVQRFQEGGPVRPEGLLSLRDALQAMPGMAPLAMAMNVGEPSDASGASGVMQALNEKLQDPNLRTNERRAVEKQRAALEFAINAGYGAADAVTDALSVLQSLGTGALEYGVAPVVSAVSPTLGEMIYNEIPVFEATAEELAAMGQTVPENLRPSDIPKTVGFETAGRGTPPVRPAASGMETEARESRPRGSLLPTAPTAPVPGAPVLGPSGMETEARESRPRDGAPQGGPAFERTGRQGSLVADPAAVAAGLNAPEPAVREKTVQDFMQEFTANAPKYEGADKNLMLAQIGFAIAAGESPNAMQNIANGLLAGSEMMLKDKAAKDEFNRQIQLSAMQYGLQEVSKERELGRKFTDYVASGAVDYRGKTYQPGESVPVLHSDIINGRMPAGVVSESLSDAMMTTDAALRKTAAEAVKNQTLSPEQYRETVKTLDEAASSFSAARSLIPLIESSLIRNAQGEVTGFNAAATKAINQAANFVGVDLGAQFESREAYDAAMRNVSVKMVQDLLGESGRTISDADRQLIDRLVGLQADVLSGAAVDPDVLNRKLQEILRTAESKQQSALDTYTTLMEGFGATLTPSGTPFRNIKADRVFNPPEPVRPFRYDITEDGKYVKVYTDGGQ